MDLCFLALKMNFETVNVISGIVSAVCAIISAIYLCLGHKLESKDGRLVWKSPVQLTVTILLASSAWALCCLCCLWIFEPFGSYVTDSNYLKFYGVILAFPAITSLYFTTNILFSSGKIGTDGS